MGVIAYYRKTGKVPEHGAKVKVKRDVETTAPSWLGEVEDGGLRVKLRDVVKLRQRGAIGQFAGVVPGTTFLHDAALWWIRHEDGTVSAYSAMNHLTDVSPSEKKKESKTKIAMAKEKTYAYSFSNGVESTGTLEQLTKIATALGESLDFSKIEGFVAPRGFYSSESKGLIEISSMSGHHLRRALVKSAKAYMDTVYVSTDSSAKFLEKFMGLTDNATVIDLFNELGRRK